MRSNRFFVVGLCLGIGLVFAAAFAPAAQAQSLAGYNCIQNLSNSEFKTSSASQLASHCQSDEIWQLTAVSGRGGIMSQNGVSTEQAIQDATRRSRDHYADLVSKYFRYAHGNRLKEVVAMFTDDAFATSVWRRSPSYGKEAIRGLYTRLFQDFPHIEPEILSVVIEGNHAITEQRTTIVRPDGTRVVMPFNTNHFLFEGRSHQGSAGDGQPGLAPAFVGGGWHAAVPDEPA